MRGWYPHSLILSVILTSRKYISVDTLYVRRGYCLHCQYREYGLSILDMSSGMSNTVMKKIVVIPTTRKPALSFQSLGKVWFRFHPFLFVDSELFKYFFFIILRFPTLESLRGSFFCLNCILLSLKAKIEDSFGFIFYLIILSEVKFNIFLTHFLHQWSKCCIMVRGREEEREEGRK